jgi:hypothetical protein
VSVGRSRNCVPQQIATTQRQAPVPELPQAVLRQMDWHEVLGRLKVAAPESARAGMHEHVVWGGDLVVSAFDARRQEPSVAGRNQPRADPPLADR